MDVHVNSMSCTQTVVVKDNEPPVISCPANQNVNNDAGKCYATLDVGIATATDNCGTTAVVGVRSDSKALTDPYPVGTTTITWTETDIHGNSVNCTQTVVVKDNEPPVISCPANQIGRASWRERDETLDVGIATATDNCGTTAVVGVRSDSKALTDPYPVGTTTITWTETD